MSATGAGVPHPNANIQGHGAPHAIDPAIWKVTAYSKALKALGVKGMRHLTARCIDEVSRCFNGQDIAKGPQAWALAVLASTAFNTWYQAATLDCVRTVEALRFDWNRVEVRVAVGLYGMHDASQHCERISDMRKIAFDFFTAVEANRGVASKRPGPPRAGNDDWQQGHESLIE